MKSVLNRISEPVGDHRPSSAIQVGIHPRRQGICWLFILSIPWSACFSWSRAAARAEDWLAFRGNNARSHSSQTGLPTEEKLAEAIAWKKAIPGRAVSGPIVVGGRVIVTSSDGPKDDRLYVVCFDAETGRRLWQRAFWATGRTLHHPTSAVAAPTPASDGQRIFAFYSSNDLICLDLDGNLQWLRALTADYPGAYNDTGMASSPCVVGDTVVVQMECQGDSFAIGLDKRTGENRWRVERFPSANWTSPVACNMNGREAVLLQSSDRLTAHDPQTGEQLWAYKAECSSIPSLTLDGDAVLLPSGGMTALRLPSGDEASPSVLWKQNRLAPSAASPVACNQRVYIINGAGVLVAASCQNGEILEQLRLAGTYWATPVVAGDYLYAVNQDGLLQVVRLPRGSGKAEIVARCEFGEPVLGSPAVGDGALFIRSLQHLWKLAGK
jgi:outer membrane protein assembly factor BamB